jgi:hypothetical protein
MMGGKVRIKRVIIIIPTTEKNLSTLIEVATTTMMERAMKKMMEMREHNDPPR